MKKLYQKDETWFAIFWIVLYVVLFQNADNISNSIAFPKLITAPVSLVLSAVLYGFIRKNGLTAYYGLCPFKGNMKDYLYFLPLVALCSTNLWRGVTMNLTIASSILHIISMCCVGFLEEVIFRGLLFNGMRKENEKTAILVSSLTFGIGHIVNLLSGADLLSTLLQVGYAIAIGFLFTVMFLKSGSLIPCIVAHAVINSLSAFAREGTEMFYTVTAIVIMVIAALYAIHIWKAVPAKEETNPAV